MKATRRILVVALISTLLLTLVPMTSIAATKYKKSTVYSQVYKKGNTIYCICQTGVYKVNNSTNVVDRLVKNAEPDFCAFDYMKYNKGYIYYYDENSACSGRLRRVGVASKKKKTIVGSTLGKYAISNNKLYYKEAHFNNRGDISFRNKCCNLNGSGKKKSSYAPKMTVKQSNVDGYRITSEDTIIPGTYDDGFVDVYSSFYLVKPDQTKVYLGRYRTSTYL